MDNDEAVQAYYARGEERERLSEGLGRVEFARTVEIVERTLPPPPASVADLGGGPGRYVHWLLERGHEVVLRDIVPDHIDQVRERHGDRVDAAVGDAREVDLPDDSVDAALVLGPIYHLPDLADRQRVLAEAARIVRPGGPVYVAAISRWAARIHGLLVEGMHRQFPEAVKLLPDVERSGYMPALFRGSFTGYTHRPDELVHEIETSALVLDSVVSVEGVAVTMPDLDERMDDGAERAVLLDSLRELEAIDELMGVGPHLLAIGFAP